MPTGKRALQIEMEAQGVVDPLHELERQYSHWVFDPLQGDRADMLRLGLRVGRQPRVSRFEEYLKRQDVISVGRQGHDDDHPTPGNGRTGVGCVVAHQDGRTPGCGLGADRRSEVDYSDFAASHASNSSPSPATVSQSSASSPVHSSKAVT